MSQNKHKPILPRKPRTKPQKWLHQDAMPSPGLGHILERLVWVQSGRHETYHMARQLTQEVATIENTSMHIDEAGNILVTKGKVKGDAYYPCLVAHYDTVHDIVPDREHTVYKLYSHEWKSVVYTSPSGVGGDDKVGLAIVLSLLHTLPAVKVAFFVGEESGCIGSSFVDMEFFADCGYIIEPDRRGHELRAQQDLVTSYSGDDIVSKEAKEKVKPIASYLGYSESSGAVTDVMQLFERRVGVSVFNLSCGYHNPHSTDEFIVWEQVQVASRLVSGMVEVLGHKPYPQLPQPPKMWHREKHTTTTYTPNYTSRFSSIYDDVEVEITSDDIPHQRGEYWTLAEIPFTLDGEAFEASVVFSLIDAEDFDIVSVSYEGELHDISAALAEDELNALHEAIAEYAKATLAEQS